MARRSPRIHAIVVPAAKLVDYLLNEAHPRGRGKAKFLRQFGFRRSRPEVLAEALMWHFSDRGITATSESEWGTIIHVDGPLSTPAGVTAMVRTVWIVKVGRAGEAHFVTAKPLPRRTA